jgi:hypothetical protein
MVALPAEDDDGQKASEPVKKVDGGARQEAVDTFEGMSNEEQKFLQEHAVVIIDTHATGGDLAAYFAEHKFDNEEKLALWSLLPSNVRSAIKKAQANGAAAKA